MKKITVHNRIRREDLVRNYIDRIEVKKMELGYMSVLKKDKKLSVELEIKNIPKGEVIQESNGWFSLRTDIEYDRNTVFDSLLVMFINLEGDRMSEIHNRMSINDMINYCREVDCTIQSVSVLNEDFTTELIYRNEDS